MINWAMLVLMVLAVAASDPAGAVTREDLVCPVREDWSEDSEECPCQRDWKPESEQLRKILGAHLNWRKIEGWRDPTGPGRAILCNALLVRANLQGAYLWGADLQEAYLVDADLHRLRGESLLNLGRAEEAEAALRRAIEVAISQEAKLFEIRSAIVLARLWQEQARTDQAHDLLAPIYDWFTEGFDTRDLIEAKDLLEELGG